MLFLDDDQVRDLLPSPAGAVALMRETLLALADGSASVTPKSQVVHEEGGFANAMPAAWPERGLLGMKWVTVTPSNRERGREMIDGLMVLSAPDGSTRATLAAAELTALRTAAVSGASLALDDRPVTLLGTGVQARSHARVLEALGRGPLTVWGRRQEALDALSTWCAAHTPDLELRTTTDRAAALAGAGVVISALPIGLDGHTLAPEEVATDALLLPLDYASVAGAGIARAGTLVADDPVQFEALRPVKLGADYPSPTAATGDLLRDGRPEGLVIAQNLGSGLGDVVLADAAVRAAG
ncbi:ornithine cyclodeaminase [Brachybacterium squillarum]|uniref:ornithine cyclodeaminase n=1 Tax=Brachybacterium squillarum TaxID=661979 RepID=UPI0022224F9A|nr:ornithine cyclodeaminase [Brachybacterium squillarum]MCW1803823.1 ornithine cyclodeaminase [Brachybacterium squillarum]